jgi:hypothetical protein
VGIKNWTVKTKGISGGSGGMAAYGKYLEDANHKNHKGKTEAITHVSGNAMQLVIKMAKRASERTAKAQIAGKGGRPVETLAQSFVVSLPAELRPKPEQWTAIAQDIVRALSVKLDVTFNDLVKDMFINAHENENNPHLNLVIGKIDEHGEIRKSVTQKAALSVIKNTVNASVLRVLGVDHAEYVPQRKNVGKKEKWQHDIAMAAELARELEAKAQDLTEEILDAESTLEGMGEIIGIFKPLEAESLAEIMRPRPKSKREQEAKAEQEYEANRDRYQEAKAEQEYKTNKGRYQEDDYSPGR